MYDFLEIVNSKNPHVICYDVMGLMDPNPAKFRHRNNLLDS